MVNGEGATAFRQRCMAACDDLSTCAGFAVATCSGAECCVFKAAPAADFFAVDPSTYIRHAHAAGSSAALSAASRAAAGESAMTSEELAAFRDETLAAIAEAAKDDDGGGAQPIALTGAMIGAYSGLAAAMLVLGGVLGAVTITCLRPRLSTGSHAARLTPAQLKSSYAAAKASALPDDCSTSSQIFAGAV